MNSTSTNQSKSLKKSTLGIISCLALSHPCQAIVYAHFQQIGDDVRVTFDGTLTLDPTIGSNVTPGSSHLVGLTSTTVQVLDVTVGDARRDVGIFVDPPFALGGINPATHGTPSGRFGFAGTLLFYHPDNVTATVGSAISELTATAATNNVLLLNRSLATMGIDTTAQNTVLWRATNTNDTILFTSAVPEPSTFLLSGLAGFALLVRKRVRKLRHPIAGR